MKQNKFKIRPEHEKRIDELMAGMTLREKLGQLNMVETVPAERYEEFKERLRRGEIGSILMSIGMTAGNTPQGSISVDFYNELQRIAVEESRYGIPLIFGRDVIHGHRTVYPIPLAMSCSFNYDLIKQSYSEIAEEAANESVHWTFAPMLDLARDARWGRIVEGCGEDPYVGTLMAKAVVEGFQGESLTDKNSVMTCAKHFIGYGAVEGGRDYGHSEISDYGLYNYYLPQFRAALDAGCPTVMSSFNDINGEPVSGSRYYLTEILRDQLGFEGMVVSDYASIEELRGNGVAADRKEAAAVALTAGVDLDMWDCCYINYGEQALAEGLLTMEDIDTAVRRVLRIKLAKGLFEKPYCVPCPVDHKKHRETARKLATESMVLLKNENSVLPLKKDEKILVVGKFAKNRIDLHGSWALDGRPEETPTMIEALSDCNIVYDENCDCEQTDADTVLMIFGEPRYYTGECSCLSDISISAQEKELLKKVKALGKRAVGVFIYGRPIAMEGIADELDAVLYAWQSGSETANAVADLLFGKASPSGRLTATFPKLATHLPLYYNPYSCGHDVNTYYGQYERCGYIDGIASPYYPFGYGLTYGRFEYGEIGCDVRELTVGELRSGKKFRFTVEVKNVGEHDAAETVQLYIRDTVASIARPLRELKDFKKQMVRVGETVLFELELGERELGFYGKRGECRLEAGNFDVYIGESCLTDRKISVKLLK